jgi:hypothetical protein
VKECRTLFGNTVESGAALRAIPMLASHASRANGTRGHGSTLKTMTSAKDSTRIRVVSSRNFVVYSAIDRSSWVWIFQYSSISNDASGLQEILLRIVGVAQNRRYSIRQLSRRLKFTCRLLFENALDH